MTTIITTGRALQRVRQATYRFTTGESATTRGQTTVYVWRTLQQHRSVHYDRTDGSNYIGVLLPVFQRVEG